MQSLKNEGKKLPELTPADFNTVALVAGRLLGRQISAFFESSPGGSLGAGELADMKVEAISDAADLVQMAKHEIEIRKEK